MKSSRSSGVRMRFAPASFGAEYRGQFSGHELEIPDAVPVSLGPFNGQIDVFGPEIHRLVGMMEPQFHVGMPGPEPVQPGCQPFYGEIGVAGSRSAGPGWSVCGLLPRPGKGERKISCSSGAIFSPISVSAMLRPTRFTSGTSRSCSSRPDQMADRRRADGQFPGGAGHLVVAGDGFECPQGIQRRQPVGIHILSYSQQ